MRLCACGCGQEVRRKYVDRSHQLAHLRQLRRGHASPDLEHTEPPVHLVIPDQQMKPGVPNDHLQWIGRYIVDQFSGRPLTVIHLGDHWDMPSLSSYDKGKKQMEGRRYKADIRAGNRAFALLDDPLQAERERTGWAPRKVFLFGNHEDRITRAIEADAQLDGILTLDDCDTRDWERHGFLEPVFIDGVGYCLAPHHRVLTADLTYKPLAKVEVGDRLLAFDEAGAGPGLPRRYATGIVTRRSEATAPLYRVRLRSGKSFDVTADHRWLVRRTGKDTAWRWRHTYELRPGIHELCHPFPEWETDASWEAGWLAGFLDGEGTICKPNCKQGGIQVSFAQNEGPVLRRALSILDAFGAPYRLYDDRKCRMVRLLGPSPEKLGLLGRINAARLIEKFQPEMLGRVQTNGSRDEDLVEAIKPIGVGDIVQVETTTGTLIVEGFAHHNCHYWYNPMTGRPYGGENLTLRLKTIGHSFTQGHQQQLLHAIRFVGGKAQHGLVCGAGYQHDEDYLGPQGNAHWRGIVVCHQVEDGEYDPMFVSLDFLCRRYEGHRLRDHVGREL